jgi:hypothetical protein
MGRTATGSSFVAPDFAIADVFCAVSRTLAAGSGSDPPARGHIMAGTAGRSSSAAPGIVRPLIVRKSNGVPLWDGKARLRARMALPDEIALFAEAKNNNRPSDGLMLVYLVELDGDATD